MVPLTPLPLQPGDPEELGGYELLGRLGAGGQGVVYLGRRPSGPQVAVKLLHSRLLADAQARARFVRELAVLQRVAGFCTAQMLEADMAGDQPYIVSEYVPGPSLRELVADQGPRTGADLDRLAIGSVTALAAIHRAGIVHRDFKPHNVLIGPDGPRVIDFGIARALDAGTTMTSQIIGTPAFMAPEQLTGGRVGPAVDMFAWSATMVYAATGRDPFSGGPLPTVMYRILHEQPDLSGLPQQLRQVVTACLSKEPASRPTAEQVLLNLLGTEDLPPLAPETHADTRSPEPDATAKDRPGAHGEPARPAAEPRPYGIGSTAHMGQAAPPASGRNADGGQARARGPEVYGQRQETGPYGGGGSAGSGQAGAPEPYEVYEQRPGGGAYGSGERAASGRAAERGPAGGAPPYDQRSDQRSQAGAYGNGSAGGSRDGAGHAQDPSGTTVGYGPGHQGRAATPYQGWPMPEQRERPRSRRTPWLIAGLVLTVLLALWDVATLGTSFVGGDTSSEGGTVTVVAGALLLLALVTIVATAAAWGGGRAAVLSVIGLLVVRKAVLALLVGKAVQADGLADASTQEYLTVVAGDVALTLVAIALLWRAFWAAARR